MGRASTVAGGAVGGLFTTCRTGQGADSGASDPCCVAAEEQQQRDVRHRSLVLKVSGMACRHCVREVTTWVRDVPGVETVVADPRSCTLRLGGSMSMEDVLRALDGTSYDVEVVDG